MVSKAGATPGRESLRPVNPPIPVEASENTRRLPLAVRLKGRWLKVVSIDDLCNVNVSEVTVGLQVVDQVRVSRPQGRPRQRPASLAADKSYDSVDFRWGLRRRGIQPSVPSREWKNCRRRPGRPPLVHPVSQSRWKVKRSHGWLDNWRRLVTRYDWYTESYVTFLTIPCFMAALSRILG
jgi:hypothetical protein